MSGLPGEEGEAGGNRVMMKLSCEGDAISFYAGRGRSRAIIPPRGGAGSAEQSTKPGLNQKSSRGSGKSEVLVIIYILRFSDTSDGAESQGLPGRPGRYFYAPAHINH